jgi:ATP synthase protein I
MTDPDDDKALKARLDRLSGELDKARIEPPPFAPPIPGMSKADRAAMSLAVRATSEIVAGVAVGAVFGVGLDWLLRTRAVFLILFALLGVAAGIANVIRAVRPKSEG